ncbi:VanZ family protein [Nocardioides abyssi]|uniref:VanZ family protein n=1 Tax=Nocardioides abyssi TaxID=3058370 RepID=A0ABT8EY04_9ACTN|nr:VanZ family protein [Nocardioides abyssi]MDN4162964.1 VanZ family protein [Nocardioides abyssi]
MITTVLVEHPWLSPTALLVLVVLGPFVGAWLATRPRLAWAATALALVPVAVLTLVPVDRELFSRCEVDWSLPTIGRVELAANVVLFVAPALLAAVASRRPALAVLGASVLSAAVEAMQALVPALGRSCATNDWLSNTIGAVVGGLLGWLALSLVRRP